MAECSVFRTLDEFWPFYVSQHMRRGNRRLHFAGTTLGLLCLGAAMVLRDWRFLPAGPVLAYGLAWIGHFFIEKNAPATLRYPVLSFRADFRMYGLMLSGEMEREIARRKDRIALYLRPPQGR
ncbi:MAG: DUF962 domain-containing protein [Elusimicrobia bacterium]|nr:DUF962 domain-containing protein [Elusimicrobiota bacterium]MDE2314438.1 DUF962 domain-containing protein [Elusimicrobiota bacterium]